MITRFNICFKWKNYWLKYLLNMENFKKLPVITRLRKNFYLARLRTGSNWNSIKTINDIYEHFFLNWCYFKNHKYCPWTCRCLPAEIVNYHTKIKRVWNKILEISCRPLTRSATKLRKLRLVECYHYFFTSYTRSFPLLAFLVIAFLLTVEAQYLIIAKTIP